MKFNLIEQQKAAAKLRKAHIIHLRTVMIEIQKYWTDGDSALTSYYKGQLTRIVKQLKRELEKDDHKVNSIILDFSTKQVTEEHEKYNEVIKNVEFDKETEYPDIFVKTTMVAVLILRILKDKKLNQVFKPYLKLCDSIMQGNGQLLEGIC